MLLWGFSILKTAKKKKNRICQDEKIPGNYTYIQGKKTGQENKAISINPQTSEITMLDNSLYANVIISHLINAS